MTDLSILIPTHNRGDILGQTLHSLSELEIPEGKQLELVIVANACTDNTPEIVNEWKPRFAFPCRYVEDPVANLNVARNRAAENSSGEILAYLDDDVWVEPTWAKALINTFQDPKVNAVGGACCLVVEGC